MHTHTLCWQVAEGYGATPSFERQFYDDLHRYWVVMKGMLRILAFYLSSAVNHRSDSSAVYNVRSSVCFCLCYHGNKSVFLAKTGRRHLPSYDVSQCFLIFFYLHPEHNVVFKKMLTQWIGGLTIVFFLTSPFINSLGITWHHVKRRPLWPLSGVGFLTCAVRGWLRCHCQVYRLPTSLMTMWAPVFCQAAYCTTSTHAGS